jgi:Zn finger protein HypA/HybF involved in hydrogenase expression
VNKGLRAMRVLFKASSSVTCKDCGRELKREVNLPRLARLGCPGCHSKAWTFHDLPEDVQLPQGVASA